MAVYNVTRRVQVEEQATIDIEIPPFLTTDEDVRFYLSRYVEAEKLLKWNIVHRASNHFHSATLLNADTSLPAVVPKDPKRSIFRFWQAPNIFAG